MQTASKAAAVGVASDEVGRLPAKILRRSHRYTIRGSARAQPAHAWPDRRCGVCPCTSHTPASVYGQHVREAGHGLIYPFRPQSTAREIQGGLLTALTKLTRWELVSLCCYTWQCRAYFGSMHMLLCRGTKHAACVKGKPTQLVLLTHAMEQCQAGNGPAAKRELLQPPAVTSSRLCTCTSSCTLPCLCCQPEASPEKLERPLWSPSTSTSPLGYCST